MDNGITAEDAFRCLTVKVEAACFCLAIEVGQSSSHLQVLAGLKWLVNLYEPPRFVRSDKVCTPGSALTHIF